MPVLDDLAPIDLLIPSPHVIEHHLSRAEGERSLLERLLTLSREREAQRRRPPSHPSTEVDHADR